MPKPVVAIVGRPNVGKSTLFNRIIGRNFAVVDNMPGVTRDRNYAEAEWMGKHFLLVDTGGFEPVTEDVMYTKMREQTTLAVEEADFIIFLMDGKEGLLPADIEVSQRLRASGKPVLYAVNKVDGERHEGFIPDFYRLGIDTLLPYFGPARSGFFRPLWTRWLTSCRRPLRSRKKNRSMKFQGSPSSDGQTSENRLS